MTRPILTAALAALLPLPAHAGTPLEDALAAPADGPLYMFDVVVQHRDTEAMIRRPARRSIRILWWVLNMRTSQGLSCLAS